MRKWAKPTGAPFMAPEMSDSFEISRTLVTDKFSSQILLGELVHYSGQTQQKEGLCVRFR